MLSKSYFENRFRNLKLATHHVVFACLLVFLIEITIAYQDQVVRSGDSLYNLALSHNMAEGKGYGLDCIMHFHKLYADGIWQYDTFRAPLAPFLFLPIVTVFGKNMYAIAVLICFISAFCLPLVTYKLADEIFSNKQIGLLAALICVIHPLYFEYALSASHDVVFHLLFLTTLLFYLRGLKQPKNFLLMGLAWGLCYLTKETALAIVPILVFTTFLLALAKKISLQKHSFTFLLGSVIIFMLVISPWIIRNHRIPENEKASKSSLGAICGFYDKNILYGDRIPLWRRTDEKKGIIARFTEKPPLTVIGTVMRSEASAILHLITGLFLPGESENHYNPELSTAFYGIPYRDLEDIEATLHGTSYYSSQSVHQDGRYFEAAKKTIKSITFLGVLDTIFGKTMFIGLIGILGCMSMWQFRHHTQLLIFASLIPLFSASIALVVYAYIRYILPLFTLLLIIASAKLVLKANKRTSAIFMVLLAANFLWAGISSCVNWYCPPQGTFSEEKSARRLRRFEAATWAGNNLPAESRLLVDRGLWFNYYGSLSSVAVPYAIDEKDQLTVIIECIRNYQLTHIIVPVEKTGIARLFDPLRFEDRDILPWLTLRHEDTFGKVYAVDANAFDQFCQAIPTRSKNLNAL